MSVLRSFLLPAIALAALCDAAAASSTPWVTMQGGRVRLVTAGAPDADGRMKGVLDIELAPGWKTYWRDPGAAGVPPSVDVAASSNVVSAQLDFPAPEWHSDGEFSWAGYNRPIGLPLTFQLADAGKPITIDAAIFLGVCETICVPVKAELVVDPLSDPENPDDTALVAGAFEALPAAATPAFGLKTVSFDRGVLTLEAALPQGSGDAAMFIAGEEGYAFEQPRRLDKDGRVLFTVKASKPDVPPASGGLRYTLVTEAGAVSGVLPFF